MGLVEEVPGQADTWRNTPLGSELHIDLLQVFMGLWDECELPMILEQYRLIEKQEVYVSRTEISCTPPQWEQFTFSTAFQAA
jgi:hypothetical protein